jgi:hypothetical protein
VAIGSNVFIDDTASNKLVITGSISTTGTLSGDGSGIDNIQTSNVIGLTDNVARIGTLEADLTDNVTRIGTLEEDLSDNVTRIGTLEADLTDNVTRIGTLEEDLSDNSSRITNIESGEITITGKKTFQDDVILESNLRVQGDLLVANTINMIVSDPIMELGSNNLNTGDLGIVMTRHGATNSNVAVFYDESEDVLKLGYTLNGANDTAIELDSNTLAVSIQGNVEVGTANLFVDTTTGNVGVGTTTPGYDLDVNGDINFTGSFYQGGSPFVSSLWTAGSDSLYYRSNVEVGTANLFVDTTTGNVGVGTTTPGFSLDVHGSANVGTLTTTSVSGSGSGLTALNADNISSGTLTRPVNTTTVTIDDYLIHDGDADTKIGFPATDTFTVTTANSERMRVDSSGNVGIGTESPLTRLDVSNLSNSETTPTLTLNHSGVFDFASPAPSVWRSIDFTTDFSDTRTRQCGINLLNYSSAGTGQYGISDRMRTGLGFSVHNENGMVENALVIDKDGNVGIGVGSPQYKLHVVGGPTKSDGFVLGTANNSYTPGCIYTDSNWGMLFRSAVSSPAIADFVFNDYAGTNMMVIKSGNVGIGTTSPAYTLDVHGTSNVGALTATTGTFSSSVSTPYINGHGYVAERSYTFNPTTSTSKYFLGWTREDSMQIAIRDGGWGHGGTLYATVYYQWGNVPTIVIHKQSGNYTFYYTYESDRVYLWFNNTGYSNNNNVNHYIKMRTTSSVINTTEPGSTETYLDATIGSSAAVSFGTVRLCTTKDGNVGIGTESPTSKLHVFGGALTADTDIATFHYTNGNQSYLKIKQVKHTPDATSWTGWSTRIQQVTDVTNQSYIEFNPLDGQYATAFGRGSSEYMRIKNGGNVGIGTTSPEGALDIVTSSTTPALWLRNSTNASGCLINMTDSDTSEQYCTLDYRHANGSSLGFQNRLHFSTTETSTGGVFSTEGSLMIGVDGKDGGQMTSSTASGRKNLWIQSTYGGNTSQNYGWWIGAQNQGLTSTDNDLYFGVVRNGTLTMCGTLLDQRNAELNFTGQHRTFVKDVPIQQLEDKEGLIVSADQNDFIRMSGGIARGNEAITTNESLPIVSFSTKSNDKKCFGVVSTTEDPENRVEVYGNFASNIRKEVGDTRVYINSVGEGAVWVTNINGSLESGDYITTSNVSGYGMRQDDDILHNYTVAKITMDCDFNPQTQPKKIIKKELANVDYWIDYATSEINQEEYETLPENEREIHEDKYYKIYKREIQKVNPENDRYVHEVHEELVNVLDEHGQLQWEDHPSETEKAYKIRYLTADGQITDEANAVHIAAFVGCTYHCG